MVIPSLIQENKKNLELFKFTIDNTVSYLKVFEDWNSLVNASWSRELTSRELLSSLLKKKRRQ